jgi:hypothetical protein
MHHYLRVVNKNEKVHDEQASKKIHRSVEDRFDFCGSSADFDLLYNAGKPQSIQPFPCVYNYLLHLSPMICALSKIGIGCIPNCYIITLNFRYPSLSPTSV